MLPKCEIDGCEDQIDTHATCLCTTHYQMWKKIKEKQNQ